MVSQQLLALIQEIYAITEALLAENDAPLSSTQREHLERIQSSCGYFRDHILDGINEIDAMGRGEANHNYMSHELRTPSTTISGSLMLLYFLQQYDDAPLTEGQQNQISKISNLARELRDLVNNLLAHGELKAPYSTLRLETFSAASLFEMLLVPDHHWEFAKKLNLQLEIVSDLPHCYGDEGSTGLYIIYNLLTRVVKSGYTGVVRIILDTIEENNHDFVVVKFHLETALTNKTLFDQEALDWRVAEGVAQAQGGGLNIFRDDKNTIFRLTIPLQRPKLG